MCQPACQVMSAVSLSLLDVVARQELGSATGLFELSRAMTMILVVRFYGQSRSSSHNFRVISVARDAHQGFLSYVTDAIRNRAIV